MSLYEKLAEDVRLKEGLNACMNCGVCTALCGAAEFYNYDPRIIVDMVQTKDDTIIKNLLKSETIWYCGECMSCKTRCPRGNTPGLIIMALRSLSQELGYFVESEKGRQQLAIKRIIGENIPKTGYCVHLDIVTPEKHPEQGPIWEWLYKNKIELLKKVGANYQGDGPGALRKIPEETLEEIRKIFEVTGCNERFKKIEEYSKKKAQEMGIELNDNNDCDYIHHIFTTNNQTHTL